MSVDDDDDAAVLAAYTSRREKQQQRSRRKQASKTSTSGASSHTARRGGGGGGGGDASRKLPFSGKAKRQQLQQRRQQQQRRNEATAAAQERAVAAAAADDTGEATVATQFGEKTLRGAKLHSLLAVESDMSLAMRKQRAHEPLTNIDGTQQYEGHRDGERSGNMIPVYPTFLKGCLPRSMPLRPMPRRGETAAEIEERENALLATWIASEEKDQKLTTETEEQEEEEEHDHNTNATDTSTPHSLQGEKQNGETHKDREERSGMFERNPEVWRQLWRLMERSSVVVVLAPAAAPLLQMPMPVITRMREKSVHVIVALTKADIAGEEIAKAWVNYLRADVGVDAVVVSADARARAKSERKRGGATRWVGRKDDGVQELLNRLADVNVQRCGCSWTLGELLRIGVDKDDAAARGGDDVDHAGNDDDVVMEDDAHDDDDDEDDDHDELELELDNAVSETLAGNGRYLKRKERGVCHQLLPNAMSGDSEEEEEEKEEGKKEEEKKKEEEEDEEDLWSRAARWRRDRKLGKRRCARPSRDYVAIGVVGEPNVGKSALVNRILGRSAAGVSNTPGKTKRLQTLFLAPDIALLDCPGLIFPKPGMPRALGVLCGNLAVSQCREPYSAVRLMCDFYSAACVAKAHKVTLPRVHDDGNPRPLSPFELMEVFAEKWKFFAAKSGRADAARAANLFLRLVLTGHPLALIFWPPEALTERSCRSL